MKNIEIFSPRTGELLDTHPVDDEAHVAAAIARARAEATWWQGIGVAGRGRVLDQWRGILSRRAGELAHLVSQETGKPHFDAHLEITMVLEHLAWVIKHMKSVLREQPVRSGILMANQKSSVLRKPYGVVGVLGPWNYPVFTPMGSLVCALAAGNTVVFKPSELTPRTGKFLADSLSWAIPERHVLEAVIGDAATGEALCGGDLDKIAFTGSSETAKAVMRTCSQKLTPLVVEAGGKDACIVDESAQLEAAVTGVAWGAFANAGQTCLAVERVYVHHEVYSQFVAGILAIMSDIRDGDREDADYGPMTLARQVDVVRHHLDDALHRGARVYAAHGRSISSADEVITGTYIAPTLVLDAPHDALICTEETFGPTLVIHRVASTEEAVQRTNSSQYGLGASVYSTRRGREIAVQLRTGCVSINSVLSFAAVPALPLGGVANSGFGRIHGAEGLREFTFPQAMTYQRFPVPLAITSFARSQSTESAVQRMSMLRHSTRTLFPKFPRESLAKRVLSSLR